VGTQTENSSEPICPVVPDFLAGGGVMARAIFARDWAATPLGSFDAWPQSLRTTVSLCLASNFPINVIWGPRHIQIYNDGYRPLCGAKDALGEDYTVSWASAWPILSDAFERALAGQTSFLENTRMFLDRNGYLEETFFTFSLSPIRDETGGIGGLFHPVTETTSKMLSERRTRALRDLAAHGGKAKTVEEAGRLAIQTLSEYALDLPFLLLYVVDPITREARLLDSAHLPRGTPASPAAIEYERSGPGQWPFSQVMDSRAAVVCDRIDREFGSLQCGPYPESPQRAVVLPINLPGMEQTFGMLVAGVSPRLPWDEAYRGFGELIAAGVTTGIANARAYQEERKRAEALAELDRAKTAFFSNVSHEFRTPLTLILGPVEEIVARRETSAIVSGEQIALIHRNTLRMLKLVNTLLAFSRLEAGRVQAHFEPVDLAALTSDLSSAFRSAVEQAGLRFTVDCAPLGEPAYVDREMWEKIVLNLISNALKFTFSGEIKVALGQANGQIELSVTDTGTGIPESEVSRIFERFRRVEGSRGRTHEGTGIGLALVRELVDLHGGSVRVVSTVGKGSTFTVSISHGFAHLPADSVSHERESAWTGTGSVAFVEEASRWSQERPGESRTSSGSPFESPRVVSKATPRVLLADDNADMREYLLHLLADRFEVEAVANGEEAFRAALADPPDLVLSDVMMPVLDGFGLLHALRSDPKTATVPVILLSARAGEEARLAGLASGADDYLVKPFGARELVARVENNIRLGRLRQEIVRQQEQAALEARHAVALQQSSDALRASQERLAAIVDQATAGIAEMDLDRRFVLVNDHYCQIAGRSRAELLELRMDDITHADDWPSDLALIELAATKGKAFAIEKRHVRPDGAEIWVNNNVTAIRDGDGKIRSLIVVSIDISERRQMSDRLQRSNRELEAFAFIASHDLQEPLRMVAIYTQLLLRRHIDATDEEARDYAQLVRDGVARMRALIKDVLDYSRVIHHEELRTPTDLDASLTDALADLTEPIRESSVTITSDPLPLVLGNQAQLARVFGNLLSNAIKYRSADVPSRIHIFAERTGREWVVGVRDNGIGFDPSFATDIFGLFKRLHKETYSGTGLGLAICKHIIERLRGRIWAESQPGKGATFYFALPAS
jgi:PAS domain S-box-containing protein